MKPLFARIAMSTCRHTVLCILPISATFFYCIAVCHSCFPLNGYSNIVMPFNSYW